MNLSTETQSAGGVWRYKTVKQGLVLTRETLSENGAVASVRYLSVTILPKTESHISIVYGFNPCTMSAPTLEAAKLLGVELAVTLGL